VQAGNNVFGPEWRLGKWYDFVFTDFVALAADGGIDWMNVDWSKVNQRADTFHDNMEDFLYYFWDEEIDLEESWPKLEQNQVFNTYTTTISNMANQWYSDLQLLKQSQSATSLVEVQTTSPLDWQNYAPLVVSAMAIGTVWVRRIKEKTDNHYISSSV